MKSETGKNYVNHALSSVFSDMKLTAHLDKLEINAPSWEFGDYSTNAALVLAKKVGISPREIGVKIVEKILRQDEQGCFASVEEKGGFINFTLSHRILLENMRSILEHGDLYGASIIGEGKTVIVEYFQNNVSKPPHVGHLRSAVIGDCLLRVLKLQGYKTVSDTHIGDWGVQFGILLFAYKQYLQEGGKKEDIEKEPINELNKLYVALSARIDKDESFREKGKEEFVKLEQGDTENRELWQWFVRVSLEDFEHYRQLMDILPFDHNLGESFYEDKMPFVLEEFKTKNLIQTGESGEQYIDLEQYGLGRCILVKSDGGTTYHLRDFATYIYRKQEFNFFKNIYVVDNRQAHHFKQLFKVLELAGYATSSDSIHVDFGFMSLPEGAISTRKGTTISLQSLINEAKDRALKIIEEKNPELANKAAVAKLVALGAVKYFDLSHNRKTEIVFTWDKALSFEGNTGPYLQYTHARIQGILRKAAANSLQVTDKFPETSSLSLYELNILRKLIKFPEIITQVTEDFYPNNLCNYLFELSQLFNVFYQKIPVLQERDGLLRLFRFQLISATAQIISNGLYLLGIEAPDEM